MDWQPIETAPKDGTEILVLGQDFGDPKEGHHHVVASFVEGWFVNVYDSSEQLHFLSHWMPLPQPPQEAKP